MTRIFLKAFLEGFSGGSLLFAAKHPGIPDRLFVPEADEEASDRKTRIGLEAFLDGFTGAGLFGKLRRPGAPSEFINSHTVEQHLASGEFEETLKRHGYDVPDRPQSTADQEPKEGLTGHNVTQDQVHETMAIT
jgi:hypothetical protein